MNNIKRPWDAPRTPYFVCKSLLYNKLPGVHNLYHGQVQTLALFLTLQLQSPPFILGFSLYLWKSTKQKLHVIKARGFVIFRAIL